MQSSASFTDDSARPRASVILSIAAASLLAATAQATAEAPPAYTAGSRAFVADMAGSLGYGADALAALMADARYQQDIIDAMNRPYEAKPWREYRQLFVTPERIGGGAAFLREHADLLHQVEAAYGVPPEIVTAIVGIETNYGGTLGSHRVLDALSTLGFAYPRRADFFRKELGEFLRLAREEQVDPRTAKGSYAGAVGMPQFIPSSYRAYAVDFNGDGRRDLWDSPADVLGSVGNYLAQHGWRRDAPVAAPALLTAGRPAGIPIAEKRPVRPEQTLAQLAAAGVVPDDATGADQPAADSRATLLALDGEDTEYWLGFDNFYAITRYNHSNLYAMAAFQLSREIAARAAEEDTDNAAR
ncbi:MAG: lytic murein transglycosylase B [Thiohalocapsa sp.]|jgi:membrane-bound lytic murein transglycosylase B